MMKARLVGGTLLVSVVLAACSTTPTPIDPAPGSPSDSAARSAARSVAPPPTVAVPTETEPMVVADGRFEPIGYKGKGTASIVEDGNGKAVLQFTGFKVESGPELKVYLSSAKAGSPESEYDDDFADLGALESFSGDQTYDIPKNEDWKKRRSVVIWCAEFSVGFVVAPLDRVR